MGKGFDKFLNMIRLNDEEYDDYDEYDDFDDEFNDDYDDIPAPVVKKKVFNKPAKKVEEPKKETRSVSKKSARQESVFRPAAAASTSAASRSKIVPMKTSASRGEVCVLRPTAFEDSREISDVLLSGRAAVVNLEGIDLSVAQRIIDFISGSCYSMAGNIEKISNYIFIVTPESIEISGDIQEVISSGIHIPSFNDTFQG